MKGKRVKYREEKNHRLVNLQLLIKSRKKRRLELDQLLPLSNNTNHAKIVLF